MRPPRVRGLGRAFTCLSICLSVEAEPPRGEAVLFELRALPSLPNCLLNYVTLLPSGWVVHFWHSSSNAAMIHNSSALQPALASGRLVLQHGQSAVWAVP